MNDRGDLFSRMGRFDDADAAFADAHAKSVETVAEGLSQRTGQTVIVENRGGAGGTIGSLQVAKADPDGYTLLLGTNSIALNPWTQANPPTPRRQRRRAEWYSESRRASPQVCWRACWRSASPFRPTSLPLVTATRA